MSEIILYDLPCKDGNHCWSLNPWKTRLVLNYKNLPYKTSHVEYPSLAPLFKSFGLPPNEQATPYTSPTIRLPPSKEPPRYIMDSRKIAPELEILQPTPPLHLDSPKLAQVEELLPRILKPLAGILMPRIPRVLLNEASVEYWNRTRAERFGMPLEQLEREKGGEGAWKEIEGPVREMSALLREEGGPFVMGETVSYADFVLVGFLQFLKRVGEELFERIVGMSPELGRVYESCRVWLERDDH